MNLNLKSLGINVEWGFIVTFGGLILTRISMITATIPFLVGKPVPPMIRVGFSLTLLVFLYPYLLPKDHTLLPEAPIFVALLYLKEAFYGIAIGLAASIVFHAFEAAGSMIDNQRGAAQARLLIPQLGESSIFGNFNYLFGIVIFLSLGGHLLFFKAVVESYDLLPILTFPKTRPDFFIMTDEFIRMTGTVLLLALQLTAPILISIFVADIILGIMSKAAPAINVWELGFAIRGILGVVMYFLAIGIIASQMGKLSLGMVDGVWKIIRLLAFSPH